MAGEHLDRAHPRDGGLFIHACAISPGHEVRFPPVADTNRLI